MNLYLILTISTALFLATGWLISEWIVRARIGRIDRDGGETG